MEGHVRERPIPVSLLSLLPSAPLSSFLLLLLLLLLSTLSSLDGGGFGAVAKARGVFPPVSPRLFWSRRSGADACGFVSGFSLSLSLSPLSSLLFYYYYYFFVFKVSGQQFGHIGRASRLFLMCPCGSFLLIKIPHPLDL